jgi:predicted kinase
MASIPLIFLIGLPGSGKSTWAKALIEQAPAYRWISTDCLRQQLYGDEAVQGDWLAVWQAVQAAWRDSAIAIRQGQQQGAIYDATNVRRRDRAVALAAARQLGFTYIAGCWFDLPLALCLARNQQRSRQVPTAVIHRMHRQLLGAEPALGEGFDQLLRLDAAAAQPLSLLSSLRLPVR